MARRLLLAPVLVAVLALTGACGSASSEGGGLVSGVSNPDNDGYTGAALDQPWSTPSQDLTDTSGKPFSLVRDGAGKLTIVFFGYTRCPDVCQVVMGTLASAYAKLDKNEQAKVQVAFITTDPARDTEKVLRTYLDRLNPTFIGLTGRLATINAVGTPLHISIEKGEKLPSGGYDVTHSTSVIALGADGRAHLVWDATTSPSAMAKDIEKLLAHGAATGSA